MLRRPVEPEQHLSIRYTERLADAGAVASVGSKGDSYDNALAESFNGLHKAELIRRYGPWKNVEDVERRPWSTSTGSTTDGSTPPAATSHQPSTKPSTTVTNNRLPLERKPNHGVVFPGFGGDRLVDCMPLIFVRRRHAEALSARVPS